MASFSDCSGREWPAAPTAQEENGQLLCLFRVRMASCFFRSGGEWPAASTAQGKKCQLLLGDEKSWSNLWADRTGATAGGSGPVAVEGDQVKVEAASTLHPVRVSLQIKMASRVVGQAATVVK